MKDFKFRNAKISYYKFFLVVFFAVLIHLIIDLLFGGPQFIFYPFTLFSIGYDFSLLFPKNLQGLFFPTLDAVLLILWICYLEYKHKISSFF